MGPKRTALASTTVAVALLGVIGTGGVLLFAPDVVSQRRVAPWSPPVAGMPTPTPSARPSGDLVSPSPSPTNPRRTPSPSPSVTPKPTPTLGDAGYFQTGAVVWFVARDGTVVPVPAIPGLKVDVQSGRATYVAQAGNKYGLRVGAYAGDFKPNVTVEQPDGSRTQTGGVVAIGPVVTYLLARAVEGYQDPREQWAIALPLDIRAVPSAEYVDVSIDDLGLGGFYDSSRVLLQFPGTLPVVETIPGNAGFHVLVEQLAPTAWQCIDPARLDAASGLVDQDHPMRDLILYGSAPLDARRDIRVDHAVAMGHAMFNVRGDLSVSLLVRDDHKDIDLSRILSVDDVPVFVASTK